MMIFHQPNNDIIPSKKEIIEEKENCNHDFEDFELITIENSWENLFENDVYYNNIR